MFLIVALLALACLGQPLFGNPITTPTPVLTPSPTSTPTPTSTPSNDSLAAAAFDRGSEALKNDDYQQAIDEFTEAIRLKPDEEFAFLNRGTAYYSLQQYDKAISDFNEFIRLKPDFDAAFFNRARAYYRLQQYDKAISDFTEVIRLNPHYGAFFGGDGEAFYNRGCAYYLVSDLCIYPSAWVQPGGRTRPDSRFFSAPIGA
jgi:tetratricopeptide (TPR) repeat protein